MDNILFEYEEKLLEIFGKVPENTTDIMLNPNGTCWWNAHGAKQGKIHIDTTEKELVRIATLLASFSNQNFNENTPCISCVLPKSKYRLEILSKPIVEDICLSIRIPHNNFFSLSALVENNMLTKIQANELTGFVLSKKNIAISGQTGSGKTTLLCALANQIPENERIITIEDNTSEIVLERENFVNITARKNIFSGRQALKAALRMNPDRIIYGETRDGESAMELLKAFRTGHSGGLFTIHATSANNVERRLEDLLSEVMQANIKQFLYKTIDVAVHLDFDKMGRRTVREITIF